MARTGRPALDSAIGRGYLYFLMAVAQSLPSPHQEFIMQNIKSYQSLFPIHDIEFEWLEKGIEQGIEQGKTKGMLEQAKQTLASLDAEAAQNMAECTEISVITAAINAVVERLKSSNTRSN
jgi:aspartate/glutamate racemase